MNKFILPILLSLSVPAAALNFDGNWREQKLPLRSSNDYSLQGGSLGIASDGAVSILYRPYFAPATSASWSWSVTQSVPSTNLRAKGGDDRNLSIYFVFMPAEEAEAAKGQGLNKVLKNPNAKALIYTYGGSDGRGAAFQSPYTQGRGQVIVKAAAGNGSGSENVNLAQDYQNAYGAAPGVLVGIAVSADSDDTKSSLRATLSNLSVN